MKFMLSSINATFFKIQCTIGICNLLLFLISMLTKIIVIMILFFPHNRAALA